MPCTLGDVLEIPVFEEFLLSSGWFTGHYFTGRQCIFHNPLLLAWYAVGSLSKALGGVFDARLQGLCSHVYSWTARLTGLRSLGPILTLSPERQAVLSLFRFFYLLRQWACLASRIH